MTLENLIGRCLEAVTPDNASIARLIEASQSSLADARLSQLSTESRFDLAYKSTMQAANAALQANGYRTRTSVPGHHQTMIQTLPRTIGLDTSTMVLLDQIRKQRNEIDYSGDEVSNTLADEAVHHAELLLKRVVDWLREHRPELMPRAPKP